MWASSCASTARRSAIAPRSPVVREQHHRPAPARRGRSGQVGHLAQLDGRRHPIASRSSSSKPVIAGSSTGRPRRQQSATAQRPTAQPEQAGGGPCHGDRGQDAAPGPDPRRRLGRPALRPRCHASRSHASAQPSARLRQGWRRGVSCSEGWRAGADSRSHRGRGPILVAGAPEFPPIRGHERRGIQDHDQPEAQAATHAPAAGRGARPGHAPPVPVPGGWRPARPATPGSVRGRSSALLLQDLFEDGPLLRGQLALVDEPAQQLRPRTAEDALDQVAQQPPRDVLVRPHGR